MMYCLKYKVSIYYSTMNCVYVIFNEFAYVLGKMLI